MNELPWVECPTHEIDCAERMENRFSSTPDEIVELGRNVLSAVMKEVPPGTRFLAEAARLRTGNVFHGELTALARRVGADWRDLMLANISYDLALSMFGCSTVVLPTIDGPVVARNMDWWPEDVLAKSSCLLRYVEAGRLRFANAGWPGGVGVVTGLSARGFAVVLNAVLAPDEGPNITGYPVLLYLRRVIETATGFADALKKLSRQKLATPALITLVGSENHQRVVIERTPSRHAVRKPEREDAALIATNDYRLLFEPATNDSSEIYRTTCRRFEYLRQFYATHTSEQPIDDAKLLYALTDDQVRQQITAQHIIMRPRSQSVRMFAPRHLL